MVQSARLPTYSSVMTTAYGIADKLLKPWKHYVLQLFISTPDIFYRGLSCCAKSDGSTSSHLLSLGENVVLSSPQ